MKIPFKKDPDPFAASRYDGMVRGFRVREHKHHWWFWAILGIILLVLVTAAYGAWKFWSTQNKIQKPVAGVERTSNELEPFNALLVGSDSRKGLSAEEQFDLGAAAVGGERADTIILAHIDPRDQSVTMVQFPRDLYVPIPGVGEDKINAALEEGPGQLVKTMKALTGLEINQYVQVNIAGFRDLVDAIGGVELCIPEPIPFDPQTGIEVTEEELGMVKFDGDRALRFVRSRNFPSGDFERIQNQQRFVAAAINKVTSTSTILRPTRLNELADVASETVTTDNNTSIRSLVRLAQRLRSFDPERYEAYVVPNLGVGAAGEASVVLPDEPAMKVMFEALEENASPAESDGVPGIEPSTIKVGVYNGTSAEGRAEAAAAALIKATDVGAGPVDVVETDNADRATYKTTVIEYDEDKPETETMAELIAAAVPGATVREGEVDDDVDVSVVVGNGRFKTKPIVQILPIQLPKPSKTPAICRKD